MKTRRISELLPLAAGIASGILFFTFPPEYMGFIVRVTLSLAIAIGGYVYAIRHGQSHGRNVVLFVGGMSCLLVSLIEMALAVFTYFWFA